MIRPHITSVILSSVWLILNLSSYVAEGGLAGVVEDALSIGLSSSLMPASATSDVFLALACVGVDDDVCDISFMGGRISANFLVDYPLSCLRILCRKFWIDK